MATIADYVASEKQTYTDARERAAEAAAQAQADIPRARTKLDDLSGERTKLQDEVAQLRADLAAASSAPDAEQIGLDLEAKLQELHAKELEVADKQDEVGGLQATAAAYAKQAGRAQAAARDIEAGSAAADALKREFDALSAAIAKPRIAGVKAAASAAAPKEADARKKLGGDPHVDGDLPTDLFERAEARWTLERARIEDSREHADDVQTAAVKNQGTTAELRLDYERKRQKLRAYVGTARERLDAATTALQRVANAPALSAETRDRLAGRPATDANAKKFFDDAADAAGREETRDDKLDELYAARLAVDDARVTAILQNPDRIIENVSGVGNAKTSVTTALGNVKQADYEAVSGALNSWEAAVPEPTWALFAAYQQARATLVDLNTEDPGTLKSDVATAEELYVKQLQQDGKQIRIQWALDALAEARVGSAAAEDTTTEERLVGAVRGDAWEEAVDRT